MPKLPRDIDGLELVKALKKFGYLVVRQTGSHMRLSCAKDGLNHFITIPAHSPLKIGTFSAILDDVAAFHSIGKDELIKMLF
jgi:predicted RNA binding protein YcfA (HicA-like mRNA interferase family)